MLLVNRLWVGLFGICHWEEDAGGHAVIPGQLRGPDGHDADLSDVFGWLANRSKLHAADITGSFWYDIDTDEDLAAAEALMLAPTVAGGALQREEEGLAPA